MALRGVYSSRLLRIGRNFQKKSYSTACSSRRALGRRSTPSYNLWTPSCPSLSTCERCGAARVRVRHSYYYSTSSSDGGGEEEGEGEESDESSGGEDETVKHLHQQFALAPISIPDIFPEVPVLPVSRNPIFPKFVKMLEVRGQHTVSMATNLAPPTNQSDQ